MGRDDDSRGPTEDEISLFDRAMQDARQLDAKVRAAKPRAKSTRPKTVRPAKPKAAAKPTQATPGPTPAPPKRPVIVERKAAVPGLDRRSTQRLAKGQLPIEATLDLHGHRQATAHRALEAFILAAHRAGRRCVLVVTGKGAEKSETAAWQMGEEEPGVLKRNLPRWLAMPPLADKVLAIRPALPQHGGEGAFYVLLRRERR